MSESNSWKVSKSSKKYVHATGQELLCMKTMVRWGLLLGSLRSLQRLITIIPNVRYDHINQLHYVEFSLVV